MHTSVETDRAIDWIGTVYGVLLNDADTIERLASSFDDPPYRAAPVAPVLYIKPRNTFARDGCAVAIPDVPGWVRIDATVGAVIARTASRIAEGEALSYVGGYAVVSDLTLPHDSIYRPAVRERCRDGFCPVGTPVSPAGFDLATSEIAISINGLEVHRRSFTRLVRNLPRLLQDITAFMTLEQGDVVLVGASDDGPLARPGDTVRIDVAGLGRLDHTVVAERIS